MNKINTNVLCPNCKDKNVWPARYLIYSQSSSTSGMIRAVPVFAVLTPFLNKEVECEGCCAVWKRPELDQATRNSLIKAELKGLLTILAIIGLLAGVAWYLS